MRVLLADDEPQVRSALRLLLEHETGHAVVAEAGAADEVLGETAQSDPDLVLLDWELPGLNPVDLLGTLRRVYPHLLVVVLSGRPEANSAALVAGADAFVSKGDPPERLLGTLQGMAGRMGTR